MRPHSKIRDVACSWDWGKLSPGPAPHPQANTFSVTDNAIILLREGIAEKEDLAKRPSLKHRAKEKPEAEDWTDFVLAEQPHRRCCCRILKLCTEDKHSNSSALLLTAAAKSLQSCPTLCDPIDGSPPGSPTPGILQARTLEWIAISFSNAWKWKVKVKSLSRVRLFVTPWTVAYQAPPSMGFSRQENWSGVPLPSPLILTRLTHIFSVKA